MALSKITTKGILDGTIATADLADNAVNSAKIGADVVTLPAAVLGKMLGHSLTDKGLKAFLSDWEKLQSELSNKA